MGKASPYRLPRIEQMKRCFNEFREGPSHPVIHPPAGSMPMPPAGGTYTIYDGGIGPVVLGPQGTYRFFRSAFPLTHHA